MGCSGGAPQPDGTTGLGLHGRSSLMMSASWTTWQTCGLYSFDRHQTEDELSRKKSQTRQRDQQQRLSKEGRVGQFEADSS